MTHEDRGHYSKKHPPDRQPRPETEEAVKNRSKEGEVPCAVAFTIVDDLNVTPEEVGFTIDSLENTIVKCQLGLFGYRPQKRIVKSAESVSEELQKAINSSLVDERLPCATAWSLAERFGLPKMEISSACEKLQIKVSSCQLGAF